MKKLKDILTNGLTNIKYVTIIIISVVTNKSIVNMFGSTYAVAGNFVRKIR